MNTRKLEILIIDSDVTLHSELQACLEAEGYGTTLAGSGQAAIGLCQDKSFGVAVIDSSLPDISGVKLVQKLEKLSPQTEYIVTTGAASLKNAVESVRHRNIIAYETKPIKMEQLRSLIAQVAERKRTEEALQKSEIRYRNLVENTAAGVAILDPEGNLVYANNALCQMTGYDEEELLGRSIASLLHPEDRDKVMPVFRQMLTRREAKLNLEFRVVHKKGHTVYLSSSPSALRYRDSIAGLSAIIIDVTERKLMEEALQASERNFHNSLDNSPLGIRVVTSNGEAIYANQAMLDIYGYQSLEELKAVPVVKRYTPESYAEFLERRERRQKGQYVPTDYEVSILRKDGEVRHLQVFRKEVLWNGEPQYQVIYRDITEQKQAQNLLKTISENSPIGVYIVQDGKFQYVNPRFQESTGYSEEELLGTESLSYIFPGDRDTVRVNAILMLQGKLPYPYEYRLISKSGEVRWVMETVAPVQYRGRRATLGNYMDITQRKWIEKKVIEYEELNKLKSDLLSVVSHELRTPLTTIKGYSTMIIDYNRRLSSDEIKKSLQSIDSATDRLSELVDRLLDMSRLEAGLLRLDRTATSLTRLIKQAAREAQIRFPGDKITVNISQRLPRVMIDTRRIQEVLDNLLDNACKYSGEDARVEITGRRMCQELLISVTNQGMGIPPEELGRVFDRMYRVEQRLRPGKDGLGLGLALCRGLVEAHGGRIWMESKEGKWARCSFTLPLPGKGHDKEARKKGSTRH